MLEKREVKNKGEWGELEKRKEKMGRIGIEKKGRGRKWDEVKQRKVESGEWEEVRGVGEKWTIVNKKDTIFKYIFWERLDSLPIPECCFHFVWCQIA